MEMTISRLQRLATTPGPNMRELDNMVAGLNAADDEKDHLIKGVHTDSKEKFINSVGIVETRNGANYCLVLRDRRHVFHQYCSI